MAGAFQVGAKLGELLFDRSGGEKAYTDQLNRNYQAQSSMEKARQERLKRISREGITTEAATAAGIPLGQAPFVTSIIGAADSPNLGNAALGDLADLAIDKQRQQAFDEGNIPKFNQLTAMKKDKNYEPVVVEDGLLRPSGVALGDEGFIMTPTPTALSTIEKNEALGNAATVRANRAPPAKASHGRTESAEQRELRLAREAVQAGADPAAVAEAMRKRGYPKQAMQVYQAAK